MNKMLPSFPSTDHNFFPSSPILESSDSDGIHTFSTSDDDRLASSSTSVEETQIKHEQDEKVGNKRKRYRNFYKRDEEGNWIIPHVPLPRIPKSDIRRSYALFFTNVYNSGDGELLNKFLGQMYAHHTEHKFHLGVKGQLYELDSGKDILHRFCYENMCISPDVSFAFESNRIKVRSDGTSSLLGTFRIFGNMLLTSPFEEELLQNDALMTPSFRLDHTHGRIVSLPCQYHNQTNSYISSSSSSTNHNQNGIHNHEVSQNVKSDSQQQSFVDMITGQRRADLHILQTFKKWKYTHLFPAKEPNITTIDGNGSGSGTNVYYSGSSVFMPFAQPKILGYDITGDFVMHINADYHIQGMQMDMLDFLVVPTASLVNNRA